MRSEPPFLAAVNAAHYQSKICAASANTHDNVNAIIVPNSIGPLLFSESMAEIIWVDQMDVEAAWRLFDTYTDKEWSFTDCVSYAVMKRLGISEAFALDDDFRQFGFVNVRP